MDNQRRRDARRVGAGALDYSTSNGEVEGPPRSAHPAAGAHCLSAPAAQNHPPFTDPSNVVRCRGMSRDVAGTALLCHWRATEGFRFSGRDSGTEIDLAVAGGIPRLAIQILLVVRDRELVRSAAGMPGANSLELIRDHSLAGRYGY